MMSNPSQEWAGEFGNDYTARQVLGLPARKAMFARILASTHGVRSVMEFGANTGENLRALRELLPGVHLAGIDVNRRAVDDLIKVADFAAQGELGGPIFWGLVDLVMTRGVLIHIPQEKLAAAYAALHTHANRYILIAEYYSPKAREILYRGKPGMLWARDFAGDLMDAFPLRLVDYGFIYHRDPDHPQDDLTWFLMEKR